MTSLFILLSAMLSALVGAGPSARVMEAPMAVTGSAVEARVAAAPARAVAAHPVRNRVVLKAVLSIGIAILLFVPAVAPAWKTRRRE